MAATRRKAKAPEQNLYEDLHNEARRIYRYPTGDTIEIMMPVAISDIGPATMIWDNRGAMHVVAPGWFHLQIEPINPVALPHVPTTTEINQMISDAIAAEKRGDPDE